MLVSFVHDASSRPKTSLVKFSFLPFCGEMQLYCREACFSSCFQNLRGSRKIFASISSFWTRKCLFLRPLDASCNFPLSRSYLCKRLLPRHGCSGHASALRSAKLTDARRGGSEPATLFSLLRRKKKYASLLSLNFLSRDDE